MNDSIEKIKEDAAEVVSQYWNCANVYACKNCPSKINGKQPYKYYKTLSCHEAMILHLVDRTIEVMEGSVERTCKGVEGFCNYLECTECGESWDYMQNYCPNCGARVMR